MTVDTNGYESGQWTNQNVTFTVSGATAVSGIQMYQYSTDGGQSWKDMTVTGQTSATAESPANVTEATLTVSTDGETDYQFRAVSNAKNEGESSENFAVKIDKSTQSKVIFTSYNTSDYLTQDTITILPIIGFSGIDRIEVQKDNGQWVEVTERNENTYSYTVTENGTYTFRAINGAGTVGETNSLTYQNIDREKPVVKIDSGDYENGTWTNQAVFLSVSNTTENLGETRFEYKIGDGDWQLYTDAIEVSDETSGTTYAFKAISESGVESETVSITVRIDRQEPDGDIRFEGTSVKQSIRLIPFNQFVNHDIAVEITGTDALSGVDKVEYYRSDKVLPVDQVQNVSGWTKVDGEFSVSAEDQIQFIYYVKITDKAGNVAYFVSSGTIFDLTDPVIDGVTDGDTYYTTQSLTVSDDNLKSVTLNTAAVDKSFFLEGNTSEEYTIIATDMAGNQTEYTVTMLPITNLAEQLGTLTVNDVTSDDTENIAAVKAAVAAVDTKDATEDEKAALEEITDDCDILLAKIAETAQTISDLKESFADYDPSTVTSADKEAIEQLCEDLQNLTDSNNLTYEEKTELEKMVDDCEAMLGVIAAAGDAGSTDNMEKVENVTSDNVKPEDKDDLTAAKEDLENALKEHSGNYTEDEKVALQDQLDQINEALESLKKTETAQDAITALPETVEPDDAENGALIDAAKEKYNKLTEHEKTLIPEELKAKLESLLGNLVDYQIIAGNGSQWTLGGDGSLTITANGAYSKFTGIQIDGKAVDSENYTAVSGSTIITWKAEYLNTLSAGKHTLTVLYTDG